jgi:hypothetical protein
VPVKTTETGNKIMMDKICKYWKLNWKISPLCWNYPLLESLKNISKWEGVPFYLMVGITYAESHIWVNFAPQHCSTTNNRAGIKNSRLASQDRERDRKKGCWLHQFNSIEEFWLSFARWLKKWYIDKWCKTAECISKYRVKNDKVVKPWRSYRVNLFR